MNIPRILQRNDQFYFFFEEAAANNLAAAKELQKLCKFFKNPKESGEKIRELERKGDRIIHKIYEQLNKSFVTPIDREDIIALASAIDDIIDLIYTCSDDINNYYVTKPTKTAVDLADIIVQSTKIINDILPNIRKRRHFPLVLQGVAELNHLETQADNIFKEGIRSLFKNPKKPIDIIRWQAIYQIMEEATDKCEDIADVLGGLLVKYA